jgi:hypothetical protein
MKLYTIFISIFLVFMTLGSIRFLDDNDYIGNLVTVHANINNRDNNETISDVRLRFLVLDQGFVYSSSNQNSIKDGAMSSRVATDNLYGSNLAPGEHMIRIYVYGDDGVRRIRHRPIIIQ